MSLNDVMSGLKTVVNSTIGDEKNFKPIDKMIEESSEKNQKSYLALKSDIEDASVKILAAQNTADAANANAAAANTNATNAQTSADTAYNTAVAAQTAANTAETNSAWRYNDVIGKLETKVDKSGNAIITNSDKTYIRTSSGTDLGEEIISRYFIAGMSNKMSHTGGMSGTTSDGYLVMLGYGNSVQNSYTNAIHCPNLVIGSNNKVSNYAVGAIGTDNTNSSSGGFSLGVSNNTSGERSYTIGYGNVANKNNAVAIGYFTAVGYNKQVVVGSYNVTKDTSTDYGSFIIGAGETATNKLNTFRATRTSGVFASGSYNTSGADYAEYFEWKDRNRSKEDRVGLFVTLDGEYIKIANSKDDFILGVVSGNPSVIGDSYDDQHKDMFQKDIYGRIIFSDVEEPEKLDEDGNVIVESQIIRKPLINPNYNGEQKYIGRSERPEWDCIGMLGKLVMRDDGTCKINKYVKPNDNGEATYSEERTKYRVLSRLDDNHIKVLIL